MSRSWAQCQRLAAEEKTVRREFESMHVYNRQHNTYFQGQVWRAGFRNTYTLRLNLPEDYPDEEPELLVIDPQRLIMHDGVHAINDLDTSHSYHTHKNEDGNCVIICHTAEWDASKSSNYVLVRGVAWVTAYEAHLRSGKTIDELIHNPREMMRWIR